MIFDHLGVFVADIAQGREALTQLLGAMQWSDVFDDPGIKVRVQFGTDPSGVCYELVAPFGLGNPVDGALGAGVNILNHVAYRTADLDGEMKRMRRLGAIPTGRPMAAVAFGGRRVVFLINKLRFIIELIEDGP
jgi:methylmalonyl-CoA/ethylmalonyl-CoA epimerase